MSRSGEVQAATSTGSTGYAARQALYPPSRAEALNPSSLNCCAARALVASAGHVQ
jgi:hypothetical protein